MISLGEGVPWLWPGRLNPAGRAEWYAIGRRYGGRRADGRLSGRRWMLANWLLGIATLASRNVI